MSLNNSFGYGNCQNLNESNNNEEPLIRLESTNNENLVIMKINFTFKKLDKIMKKSEFRVKLKTFCEIQQSSKLKSLQQISKVNNVRKILQKAKILLAIFKETKNKILRRFTLKWKTNIYTKIKLNKYKLEIESNFEKKTEKEFNNKENLIKEKNDKIVEFKKSIQKNTEMIQEYNKKVKEIEEKSVKIQNSIKKIEEEKVKLTSELKASEKSNKEILVINEKLESKLKEFDSESKSLNEQINEKEYLINVFGKEMNDLLESYEQVFQNFTNEKVNHNSEFENLSKSTKPTTRTINSQISNNSQINFSNGKNQLISSIRNIGGTNNSSINTSNTKPVSISVNNPTSINKFSLGVNKLGLTNTTLNIFKSKNIN